ncbi:flavin reductase family protein [Polynucleobacter brandtiae]|uniref:Flavin reductase (DIM6/NTAB) family NADH-FMN oxidoreductase RutF n=1 Tax=Polynucleobacter brandtiae TaxID=1938816 RepID=A0A2M8VZQ0_9BURK|nr:flavin reductase family protein [Polynucleobacter brandtiae]PJI83332.1 flavin reductase (DIM6/NTAB) family NADH-FMN oxidoreductase RutF [Polynucleobacter brandtiae]
MHSRFYSYEPKNGHGLAHDPFNAIVGPRPIGWISTKSNAGICNLAPYSFFNAFNYVPPIIGFSSIGHKDSLRNIEENGEFVWNLVTKSLAEQMNTTCTSVGPDVNEFVLAGLDTVASTILSVPRVALSPVSFECRATQIIQLEGLDKQKVQSWLILGEVLNIHIDEAFLKGGIYDTASAGHILRGGGPADYFTVGQEQLFKMTRPKSI